MRSNITRAKLASVALLVTATGCATHAQASPAPTTAAPASVAVTAPSPTATIDCAAAENRQAKACWNTAPATVKPSAGGTGSLMHLPMGTPVTYDGFTLTLQPHAQAAGIPNAHGGFDIGTYLTFSETAHSDNTPCIGVDDIYVLSNGTRLPKAVQIAPNLRCDVLNTDETGRQALGFPFGIYGVQGTAYVEKGSAVTVVFAPGEGSPVASWDYYPSRDL